LEQRTEGPACVQDRAHERHTIHSLPVLVVHAHSSCNCRCIMCDIWKTQDAKIFSVQDLERQLPSIRQLGVRWVVFSGGEPLMNPELPQLCAILRRERVRLTLLTTGLLLKKYAAEVAAGFDDVIVSLDGPRAIHDQIRRVQGAFDLLESGVQALRKSRPEMQISARTTVQKANCHSLRETARAAKRLQLNGISFLAVDLTSTAFNRPLAWPVSRQAEMGLSPDELAILENEIAGLILDSDREYPHDFIAESPEKLQRIVRHFRVQLGLAAAEAPMCNAPWVSAVIDVDGTVRPCFFHAPMGHLQAGNLSDVVNGEGARAFRANLDIANNPTCRNCVCSLNYRL
jgi:MoaA/NifB/PqqE/SkfB family radical SAM enzyme